MKVTKLTIKNIGKIADEEIKLNKPLILFYGDIRQGKTTILNAVRWVCGGKFPDDIIRHGEAEASVTLEFKGGSVSRSWYRSKQDGSIKARDISFILNGKPQARPAEKIRALLNPFLLDQDFLRNKTELERRQYFAELFSVNTDDLDGELRASEEEARQLRARIQAYGEIDLAPVEAVDVAALRAQLEEIKAANRNLKNEYGVLSIHRNGRLNLRARLADRRDQLKREIDELEQRLVKLRSEHEETLLGLGENQPIPPIPEPIFKSTDAVEEQLREAGATNVRAEQYQANLRRAAQLKADQEALRMYEQRHRDIKQRKQALLKNISASCGIKGLEFDEAGNFIYEGSAAGMVSDSQIMRLSSELSSLYPEGFGLDLIDRGESLGRSIFEFVERAKREEKTIIATIVGEKPASVPEDVGVFVVTDGKVS